MMGRGQNRAEWGGVNQGLARTRDGGARPPFSGGLSFPWFGGVGAGGPRVGTQGEMRMGAILCKELGADGRSARLRADSRARSRAAGCFGKTFQRGYVLPDGTALEQIRLGASQGKTRC